MSALSRRGSGYVRCCEPEEARGLAAFCREKQRLPRRSTELAPSTLPRSPLLPICVCASTTCSPVAPIGMMAVVEGKQDLHEVVPDRIFGYRSVVSLGVLDDGREVATAAVLH